MQTTWELRKTGRGGAAGRAELSRRHATVRPLTLLPLTWLWKIPSPTSHSAPLTQAWEWPLGVMLRAPGNSQPLTTGDTQLTHHLLAAGPGLRPQLALHQPVQPKGVQEWGRLGLSSAPASLGTKCSHSLAQVEFPKCFTCYYY